jgi:hypothetical protein
MKNIVILLQFGLILLIILIHPGNPAFSQSLKNVKIGGKYSGPKSIETSVGGISGTLTIGSLKDGTVYSFHFVSNNTINNRTEIPLFISDADNFLKNMNKNFNISLDCKDWKHKEYSTGNWYDVATCSKDSASFLLSFTVNLNEHISSILLTITNQALSSKGAYEHLMK